MKTHIRNILSVMLLFCTLSFIHAADDHDLKDQEIADAIENEYLFDHAINVNKIDIEVNNGIAELTGDVDNLQAKVRATKIAEMVKGVRAVSNRIDVDPPMSMSDVGIRSKVLDALLQDPATDSYEVGVAVNNGVVTLTGETDSYHESQLCKDVAMNVKGVTGINNEITVDYDTDRADAEIQAEIKGLLKWNKLVDDGLLDVSVKNGKVKLSGTVGSAAEKSAAKWNAWVAGVKDVNVKKLNVEWWAKDADLRQNKDLDVPDAEIKQAIKDAALYDPRVFSFNIQPEVIDGWVTLRGTVDNLKAKNAAGRLAKNTVGVVDVTNRLKVRTEMPPTDREIEMAIESALFENSITESHEVDANVKDGSVNLIGTVDSYLERSEAEWIASGMNGVTDVNNNIDVEYPYGYYWYDSYPYYTWYYNPPERTEIVTIQYPDDQKIKNKVSQELWWSPFVTRDQVSITVDNGTVILDGTVDSWREYRSASKNAWEGGAWDVSNQLEVGNGSN